MIEVTLLGTSALLPLPERGVTAASLRCGGHTLLIDCGEGTQTAARRYDTSVFTADVVALTHYHGDHIFGLPGYLATMETMGRTAPLTITGPAVIQQQLAAVMQLTGPTAYPIRLLELPPQGLPMTELAPGWPAEARLTPIPTEHRVISQGYAFTLGRAGRFDAERARALGLPVQLWGRLQRGETVLHQGRSIPPEAVLGAPRRGLKVVMTGDTALCPSLMAGAADADLLISDATYGDPEHEAMAAEYGHMTFGQAGQLAAQTQAKRLWLAHFSQRMQSVEDYLPYAQAHFPNAVCGADGMRIKLCFTEEA